MDRAEQRALRSHRGTRLAALVVFVFLGAVSIPRPLSACPENQLRFGVLLAQDSSAVHDTTFGPVDGCGFGAGSWDLVQGTLALDQRPCLASSSKCQVADDYTVVGIPGGTPVLVIVTLDVHGDTPVLCGGSGCGVTRRATLTSASSFAVSNWSNPGPLAEQLVIVVAATAGAPFRVQATLEIPSCGGGSEGSLTGRISFGVMSSAGGVVSCQGFAGTVTPARETTWGRLRASYR
jgi:hypothetical protein